MNPGKSTKLIEHDDEIKSYIQYFIPDLLRGPHYVCRKRDGRAVKPLFNQYSKTHKITIHQGNNSR